VFHVGPEDGPTVADALVRAGADPRAAQDGRVFVGRRRVKGPKEPVENGDVLEIAMPSAQVGAVHVLAQTDDLLAVEKPAGMPTIADHAGCAHALVAAAARSIGIDAARLHPTSRLDRDVSGVVVFALTKNAAERLTRARAAGTYDRRYVALATRTPDPKDGVWDAPIGRAKNPRLRAAHGRDAVPAESRYATCGVSPGGVALLAVAPATGRTHQIRVHASRAGTPLIGDAAYGGPTRVTLANGRVLEPRRVALHAARVVVPNARGEALVAISPVPVELTDLWSALGGLPAAWELATACPLP
jgi:23S rRNA pseudouridine1911/1915/1917 synthase